MKLQEKIIYCRKKAVLSQEELAGKLDVSRQAVSKWETGDAVPEVSKLLLLADVFGVTTDWLLRDDMLEEKEAAPPPVQEIQPAEKTSWLDSLPNVIERLVRRYGWLAGVYLAASGVGFIFIGALARYLVRSMSGGNAFDEMGGGFFGGSTLYFDSYGTLMNSGFPNVSNVAANNPVSVMGTVIMVIGIVLLVTGVVLAVALKRRGKA